SFRHSQQRQNWPAVGDWVVYSMHSTHDQAVIGRVLQRKTTLLRKHAGETSEVQIIATNIDYLFIASSLNHDFNIRRLERYLTVAWDSGAQPVLLLTKADLCEDLEQTMQELS